MVSLVVRPILGNHLNRSIKALTTCSKRYVMEVRFEDFGSYPESVDESNPRDVISRSLPDTRFVTQIFERRQFMGDIHNPIVLPSLSDRRMVGCACEHDSHHLVFMWLVKDEPKQCECGYWMELVNADAHSLAEMYNFDHVQNVMLPHEIELLKLEQADDKDNLNSERNDDTTSKPS